MPKFKQFLQEMIQFSFGIHYVDSEGKDQSVTVKASNQSQAIQKFKGMDSTQGYKNILQVRKGDVVPPNETNESLLKEENKNRDYVMKEYPTAQLYSSFKEYQIIYPKEGKSKTQKYVSIGKGNTPEEAWNQAKIYIDNFRPEKKTEESDPDLNKDLVDRIEKIKSERNWNSLGSIQKAQVEKFVQKIYFDSDDIGTRVKAKQISKWDDLIDVIKKSKLKMKFHG